MSNSAQTNHATGTRDPRRWWILFACVLAVLTVAVDSVMLTLLMPAIQNEVDATQAQIGLMTSISALMLSAFILAGGTLGDLYGRKRFMLLGTGGMVLAAVLCTVVPGANALIAVRAVDGVCQALVNPLALAVLAVTFDDEERPKAPGIYGASRRTGSGTGSPAKTAHP